MRSIRIIDPGPFAAVQDRGRYGYRSMGVPLSGAMDLQALRVGNLLVGNGEGAAAVEIAMGGYRAEFQCSACLALTGAARQAHLNGKTISFWQTYSAKKGDLLEVDSTGPGLRTYFSVSGGIDVPPVMESRSTYVRGGFGGLDGRALRAGDLLPLGTTCGEAKKYPAPPALIPQYSAEPGLRVVPGPQDERVSLRGKSVFFSAWFEVTPRADRMGIALSGPAVELSRGADIISDGACPGAVQVHGNGQPTILVADCQTAGGYVKIATVISADLPLVAQLVPGNRVRFEEVNLWQAREFYIKNEFLIRSFQQ
ncbi:MAG: biotin-dependent carboxyltransferase family protein [Syntrophobacteraceae bacterium]